MDPLLSFSTSPPPPPAYNNPVLDPATAAAELDPYLAGFTAGARAAAAARAAHAQAQAISSSTASTSAAAPVPLDFHINPSIVPSQPQQWSFYQMLPPVTHHTTTTTAAAPSPFSSMSDFLYSSSSPVNDPVFGMSGAVAAEGGGGAGGGRAGTETGADLSFLEALSMEQELALLTEHILDTSMCDVDTGSTEEGGMQGGGGDGDNQAIGMMGTFGTTTQGMDLGSGEDIKPVQPIVEPPLSVPQNHTYALSSTSMPAVATVPPAAPVGNVRSGTTGPPPLPRLIVSAPTVPKRAKKPAATASTKPPHKKVRSGAKTKGHPAETTDSETVVPSPA
ncbi:hypothetical protein HK104_006636, partial [Borealophlyctis nickersoniae]